MGKVEKKYLKRLKDFLELGLREEGYYLLLIDLFKEKGLEAVQLPAKTKVGFPDIKVFQKEGFITGYVECKKPEEDIEKWAKSEQVKRYRSYFKNFLLTNFISFKHFLNGKEVRTVQLIPYKDLQKGNFKSARLEEFEELLKDFLNHRERPLKSVEELAESLAWRVRLLKDELLKELKINASLQEFLSLLRDYVVHTLTEEEFADAIAQSLSYALLIVRTKKEFIRKEDVISDIPDSLTIIRDIFLEILKIEGKELNWIIEEIENTLNLFDLNSAKLTPEELTIHFYETFLRSYNPKLREIRGVYYTPKPVVKFIVRSIEEFLREKFGLNGYFDERLKLLDPAGGTLTFILDVFERLREEIKETAGSGMLKSYFENAVLQNFFAFELLPAPYVIGHLKVSQFLNSIGVKNRRFNFYLTNALEFEHKTAGYLFSHRWAKEIQEADRIKREEKMLVIVGNPPYSGISANNSKEINNFLKIDIDNCQSYYKVDGKRLEERNPKWLQDDYVKFIRFAQWKISQNERGIVGFITNHAYIDNPTFRGMRQSLLKTFDRIYILDLHGNKRKKEPDENVFDIQQGVAIGIFVKDGSKKGEYAEVYYHSTLEDEKLLTRSEKFDFLERNSVNTVNWGKVNPKSPYYFFKPVGEDEEYQEFLRLDEIFEVYGVGITTARDEFVIDRDKERLFKRIISFRNHPRDEESLHRDFGIRKKKGWDICKAWDMLQQLSEKEIKNLVVEILYRPFDKKFIFWHRSLTWRPVEKVMKHMLYCKNLGLIICKQWQAIGSENYDTVFVTNIVSDLNIFRRGGGTLFPLYLCIDSGKFPNFTERFKNYIKELYSKELSPEEIFYYIYAVLYSPDYRERYGELLKYEFPRIPFPKDYRKLKEIAEYGEKLVNLHLLKSKELEKFSVKFEGKGDNRIEKVSYRDRKVYINENQYFYPVEKELWEYRIGGYQVLKKWLSDRKGRVLSYQDIKNYLKIVRAIEETLKIQEELSQWKY